MIVQRSTLVLVLPTVFFFVGCASPHQFVDTPQKRGELLDGLQTGPWYYFYGNGQKMAAGEYELDRQTGLWTYWYDDGREEWQGIFEQHALEGPSSSWHPDGSERTHGYFVGGKETGPWSFWKRGGQLEQTGTFLAGKRTLRWTHFHDDGSVRAEGYRFNDRSMGLWSFWDGAGALTQKSFPSPPGVELCQETWPDGSLRREGYLLQGKPHGIWVSWHAGGARRMQGEFNRGVAQGRWRAWEADGSPLALGEFEADQPAGMWTLWVDQQASQVDCTRFVLASETDQWSEDSVSTWFPALEVVPTWIAELRFPSEGLEVQPATAAEPEQRELLAIGRRPRIPIREQPWTVDEEQNMQTLVALYSDKASRRRSGGRYGSRSRRATKKGDEISAGKRIGRRLPVTELLRGDDEALNLSEFEGEKYVLLVILRGYAGYVCAYCAAQTKALREHFDRFDELNTEVIVVYPGNRDRLDAFLRSYESLVDDEGALPFTVAYDEDFRLVDSLDLRSDLALPTTLLLDREGVVRYAYIGTDKADRPSAEALIEAVQALDNQ